MMANLYDVVVLEKPTRAKVSKAEIENYNNLITDWENFSKFVKDVMPEYSSRDKVVTPIIESLNSKIQKLRTKSFEDNGFLPKELENIKRYYIPERYSYRNNSEMEVSISKELIDEFTTLSATPRTKLSELKMIADKLGMIVIPYDYLNPKSYRDESYELRNSITNFVSVSKKIGAQTYVICPPNHYGIEQHVKSENPDLPIYGGVHQTIFMTIGMNIPMFRSILNDLSELRGKVSNLDRNIQNINQNMISMQNQIDSLSKEVERLRKQANESQIRAKEAELRAAAAESEIKRLSEIQFVSYDPMMIMLPKNKNMHDDTLVYVGPCWGKDFDDLLIEFNNLIKFDKQRQAITNKMSSLYRR